MPLTCYCKACGHEVPPGESCPTCGAPLKPSAARLYWETSRLPVLDWMCWNSILRVLLPVYLLTNGIILAVELCAGGLGALEALLLSGYGRMAIIILLLLLLATGIVLLLRGRETLSCWLDQRGIHLVISTLEPTRLRLVCRGLPSTLLKKHKEGQPLKLNETQITWKELRRIQVWRQKGLILAYAPRYWQRLALPCPASCWAEALVNIQEHLVKHKDVKLPEVIRPREDKPRRPWFANITGTGRKTSGKTKAGKSSAKKKQVSKKSGKPNAKSKRTNSSKRPSSVSIEEIIAMNEEEARRQAKDSERENRKRR